MSSLVKVSAALLFLSLSACGTARLAGVRGGGGSVQLEGRYMPAMTEARFLMGDHCGSRYRAVENGSRIDFVCDGLDDRIVQSVASR